MNLDSDSNLRISGSDRVRALINSAFSASAVGGGRSNSYHLALSGERLKIPFTIKGEEWRSLGNPQHRVGGWGPLFGGVVLLVGLAIAVQLGTTTRRALLLYGSFVLLIAFTVLIVPPCWMARYVPQSWWPVAGPIILGKGRLPIRHRLSVIVLVVAALVNSGLVGFQRIAASTERSKIFETQLVELSEAKGATPVYYGRFHSNRFHLRASGLVAESTDDPRYSLDVVVGRKSAGIRQIRDLRKQGRGVRLRWRGSPEFTKYRLKAWTVGTPEEAPRLAMDLELQATTVRLQDLEPPIRFELVTCNKLGCGPPADSLWTTRANEDNPLPIDSVAAD
jgi:hypothetical protein